jgi:hypothetical protein
LPALPASDDRARRGCAAQFVSAADAARSGTVFAESAWRLWPSTANAVRSILSAEQRPANVWFDVAVLTFDITI